MPTPITHDEARAVIARPRSVPRLTPGPFDAARVAKASLTAARQMCGRVGGMADVEDVAQEIAIRVMAAHARGFRSGRRAYYLFARDAMRALFGSDHDGRPAVRRFVPVGLLAGDVDESVSPPSVSHNNDVRAISLSRLASVWPTLTPFQRACLFAAASGSDRQEIAADMGTSPGSVDNALKQARARIDNPGAFTRVASRVGYRRVMGGGYVARVEG